MAEQSFAFPDFTPLTRLHVQDSLRINAERWLLAHNYHRQRQNLHYQALWEPGIVCGLGVKTIAPPEAVPSQFRDQRWLEIQPGIAIDVEGNPIVVGPTEDRTYRIAAPAPVKGTRLLQVVVRYVDPDNLEVDVQDDRVVERFRFDQRIGPLRAKDIELCRIELAPGETILQDPEDPFEPQPNELDLRHRRAAQLRPQIQVHIGTLMPLSNQQYRHWQTLLETLPSLHNSSFQGHLTAAPVDPISPETLLPYDLVYVSGRTLLQWQSEARTREWEALRQYLLADGFLYVEGDYQQPLLQSLLQQLALEMMQSLPNRHPLKLHPFRFGQLPLTEQGPVELIYGGGVLLTPAALAATWDNDYLPRYEIRSAQELGANILYYAWQRRYFRQLLS
ncbi:MAG: DUF4159 domain-containing protein [Leptolyngbyaceae cyanobacterium]